jgi:hypothetical protein
MPRDFIERIVQGVAILAWLAAAPEALAKPRRGNSAATITASFADSCRDLAAHSSKDISHVEFHYVDGRVTKDESIGSQDYVTDGGAGDEIEFVIVKSGTTSEQFDCVQTSRAPTAALEIKTPPIDYTVDTCYDFWAGGLACEQSSPRTDWTNTSEIPDDGGTQSGIFSWSCGALGDSSACPFTVSFRGTGSSDPDGDISSWSLDFGDGTSVSGSWSAALPIEIAHEYPRDYTSSCGGVVNSNNNVCVITLTVTDSAGQSHSDTMAMVFIDHTPD